MKRWQKHPCLIAVARVGVVLVTAERVAVAVTTGDELLAVIRAPAVATSCSAVVLENTPTFRGCNGVAVTEESAAQTTLVACTDLSVGGTGPDGKGGEDKEKAKEGDNRDHG